MLYYNHSTVVGLIGFKYNEDIFYYIKNISNDIIGILDSDYILVAKYIYDSWGNIISITDNNGNDISNNTNHIANINPFRYRSYYYDVETKMYYLNSRYYNPEIGRFINADGILGANQDLLSYNLYAYVSNNPIMYSDSDGNIALNAVLGIAKSAAAKAAAVANPPKTAPKTPVSKSIATPNVIVQYAVAAAAVKSTGMSQQTHYGRNDYNINVPMTIDGARIGEFFKSNAPCHQFDVTGKENIKYVHNDGREVIFTHDGVVVWDANNMGTYNYHNTSKDKRDKAEHYQKDVAPWIIWGNASTDTTTIEQRINSYKGW